MKTPSSAPIEEIKLVPYRWEWEKQYGRERKNLEKEIGDHVLDIEHIGSTAVPEMSARPVVDILIGIGDLAELPGFEDILNQMGYARSYPAGDAGAVVYEAGGRQAFSLRFVPARSLKGTSALRLRDALIADARLAKEFKEMKIKLCRKYALDPKRYSEGKGRWISTFLKGG